MKYTLMIVALLCATACVSPEAHRQVQGANAALKAQIDDLSRKQLDLSAENERLRNENRELGSRAADAAYIEDQKKRLDKLLAKFGTGTESAANGVELVQTPEGYAFRVAGGVLFAPGQNTLSEQGRRTLTELISSLAGQSVRVEGHTDDTPIVRSQWGTNLRLSVERSMVVADFLIQAGLPAEKVSVAGYGEYRPAADGSSEEARKVNRRVEILMLQR